MNTQLGIHPACDTYHHDMRNSKAVDQDLCSDSRIDFADPAGCYNDGQTVDLAFKHGDPSDGGLLGYLQMGRKLPQF